MAKKIFRRFGLRRSENFLDIPDPTTALNNLLGGLATDLATDTFITQDLDAIRGLSAFSLEPEEYRKFAGSAISNTDSTGSTENITPAITYQNRLDRFEVFAGDPRLNGGNGLTANYFNEDQVRSTSTNIGDPVFNIGITTGTDIPTDTFWESGNFDYTGKIHPQSVNAAGGVQWDGTFIPTVTGKYRFNTSSSLNFTVEFETEGYTTGINTFTEYSRLGTQVQTTNGTTASTNQYTVNLAQNPNALVQIGMGMSVSGTGIRAGSFVASDPIPNRETGLITLDNPDGDPIISAQSGVTATFFRSPGESVSSQFTTQVLQEFQRYKVRFRVFVPYGVSGFGVDKNINFDFSRQAGTLGDLRYTSLYSLDYDFSDDAKGKFNKFIDTSIRFGGGQIGSTSDAQKYVKISSEKKVDIRYQPKTSLSGIIRATRNGNISSGSNVITIGDTTDIEIGTYVFGSGLTSNIDTPLRVIDFSINEFLIVDGFATTSGTDVPLTFVNHRGFVKRVTGSISSNTINLSNGNTSNLRTNMLAIYDGMPTGYTGITTSNSASSVALQSSRSNIGSRSFYFYQSRGLIDRGLAAFCVPADTKCIRAQSTINQGTTSLTNLSSTSGISNGWYVYGSAFQDDTQITGFSANSISINKPTIRDISADATFTTASASDDRQLCCPPTDTSPPFTATELGLQTTLTHPNLRINNGNLVFDSLIINDSTNVVSTASPSDTATKTLDIFYKTGTVGVGLTYQVLME